MRIVAFFASLLLVSAPAPAAELKSAPVELREVELTYSSDAVIEAVRQSTVAAQIQGRIVELRFDVGDYVKKGDVIVRIDERQVGQAADASAAQVSEAQAALANARATYERTKQLLAQKFVSRSALDRAESEYRAAQARVTALLAGAAAAATEKSFATVVAPYSGVVSARHVELGEMATPGKPLMTGFDPSTLRAVADVPATQIGAVRAIGRARIEVPSLGRWFDVKSITVLPTTDPRTQTTRVRLDLPEDVRGIYPGVYARAHFVTGKSPRLLVPRAAVFHRSELTAVYVIDPKGRPQLRQIRVGSAGDENAVEVLTGLRRRKPSPWVRPAASRVFSRPRSSRR
jgi:RND family efflux transporter MFP subunit